MLLYSVSFDDYGKCIAGSMRDEQCSHDVNYIDKRLVCGFLTLQSKLIHVMNIIIMIHHHL